MSTYQKRKALGLCVRCGKKARTNKVHCQNCHNAYQARTAGCQECNSTKAPLLPGVKVCEICYFKKASRRYFGNVSYWQELKNKFQEQKGHCAYSGRNLILGSNAQLDHIVPQSHGGPHSIANLQWVDGRINKLKSYFSQTEFLTLVKEIYEANFKK